MFFLSEKCSGTYPQTRIFKDSKTVLGFTVKSYLF